MLPSEEELFNSDVINSMQNAEEVLLRQYEKYVELMDNVYDRRSKVNAFYLSLNSILLTGLAGLAGFLSQALATDFNHIWIFVAASAGVVFCATWRVAVLSSRALIVAKYRVVHRLEKKLPANLFRYEWDIMMQGKHKYISFSKVEGIIPLIFIVAYIATIAISVVQLLTS